MTQQQDEDVMLCTEGDHTSQ